MNTAVDRSSLFGRTSVISSLYRTRSRNTEKRKATFLDRGLEGTGERGENDENKLKGATRRKYFTPLYLWKKRERRCVCVSREKRERRRIVQRKEKMAQLLCTPVRARPREREREGPSGTRGHPTVTHTVETLVILLLLLHLLLSLPPPSLPTPHPPSLPVPSLGITRC